MYAVISSGNKQYKVKKDDIIDLELLEPSKDELKLDKVLFYSDGKKAEIGTPYLKDVHVSAKVIGNVKDKKVTTFKYKHKVNYHRTIGHRQNYTRVQITGIHAK